MPTPTPRSPTPGPWYREPWPWLLAAGPAVVVVAGLVTTWLAVRSDDGLVAGDYYRRGLAVNRTLERVDAGMRAGAGATLTVAEGRIEVVLGPSVEPPPALHLSLRHPTRAGLDRELPLRHAGSATYRSEAAELPAGRWRVSLEAAEWTLRADAELAPGATVQLRPQP